MNITNMKRLLTHLELDGQKFDYSCFVGRRDHPAPDEWDEEDNALEETPQSLRDLYHCKGETVGCLAGMAAAIAIAEDNVDTSDYIEASGTIIHTEGLAGDWLGLNSDERNSLFYGQAMVDLGIYESSGVALASATPLDAAKTVQAWIDREEQA